MTREEKDLLLKDLCARLPYGVIVKFEVDISYDTAFESVYQTSCFNGELLSLNVDTEEVELLTISNDSNVIRHIYELLIAQPVTFIECIPYLFPLSSMSDEQKKYINDRWGINEDFDFEINPNWGRYSIDLCDMVDYISWLNKNHFDYRGLISKGLAIDCTNLDIY